MTFINLIIYIVGLAIILNGIYGLLFLFSFKGVRRLYLWFKGDSFLFMDQIGFLVFGLSYYLAEKLYKYNGFVARLVLLLYVIIMFILYDKVLDLFDYVNRN